MTVRPGGLTVSRKPRRLASTAGKRAVRRGAVRGYTGESSRRLAERLQCVDPTEVDWGMAVSLTLTAPAGVFESVDHWQRVRSAYRKRLVRAGAFSGALWCVEWHRSGAPHLHLVLFGVKDARALVDHWLALVPGALRCAQDVSWIRHPDRWLKYLAKHGGRGAEHVQRVGAGPWDGSSGRMWGEWGRVSRARPVVVDVCAADFYRARRVAVRLQLAGSRGSGSVVSCKWDTRKRELNVAMKKVKSRRRAIRKSRKSGRVGQASRLHPVDRPDYHKQAARVRPVTVWRDPTDEFWSALGGLFPGLDDRVRNGESQVEIFWD